MKWPSSIERYSGLSRIRLHCGIRMNALFIFSRIPKKRKMPCNTIRMSGNYAVLEHSGGQALPQVPIDDIYIREAPEIVALEIPLVQISESRLQVA